MIFIDILVNVQTTLGILGNTYAHTHPHTHSHNASITKSNQWKIEKEREKRAISIPTTTTIKTERRIKDRINNLFMFMYGVRCIPSTKVFCSMRFSVFSFYYTAQSFLFFSSAISTLNMYFFLVALSMPPNNHTAYFFTQIQLSGASFKRCFALFNKSNFFFPKLAHKLCVPIPIDMRQKQNRTGI